jgi:PAS domain S-box-containing protein
MPIRILHLEDIPADAELVQANLEADGLAVEVQVVASRAAFEAALQPGPLDVILADFSLPAFDGLTALALAQQAVPEVPFIFVTGRLLEEQAIESLKKGATDYVYKNRLSRLAPAVRRALREAEERQARQRAQAAVQSEREWLRVTLSSIGDAVIATDTDGRLTFMNAVAEKLTGWTQAEAVTCDIDQVFHIVDEAGRPIESPVTRALREGGRIALTSATLLITRDGRSVPIDDSGAPIRDDMGRLLGVVLVFRDITERRQAELARREAEARFQIMANTAPVMMWMSDALGNCEFVNKAWLTFTGRALEQEQGQGWLDGVHPDDRERALETFRANLIAHQSFELEFRLRRSDGLYRWVVDMSVPRFTADGTFAGLIASCVDIHDRKTAASALEARASQQAVVAELGQHALAGLPLPELMQRAAERVASTCNVEYCEILQLEPDAQALRLVAGVGWTDGLIGAALVGAEQSLAGFTLASDLPVIITDLRAETRFKATPLLVDHQVVSGLCVVIRGTERPYGVLGAHTAQPRGFTAEDASFLLTVANVLGEAVARHRAEDALRGLTVRLDRALAEAELLNTIASHTSGEADLGRLLTTVLHHLRRVLAFTGGSIALVEDDDLVIRAAAGPFAEQARGQRLPKGAGMSWRVIDTGQPFRAGDLQAQGLSATTPIRSYLAVPLVWREQIFGLLEVDSTEPNAFGPSDESLLQRVATVLSGSIQLAELHGLLEQRVLERTAALRAANEKLQTSEHLLAEAQAIAELGSWHWDILSDTVTWSDELYRIYGQTPGAFEGTYEGFLAAVHPQDRPVVQGLINQALQDHQPFTFDHRVIRPDGRVRALHARGEVAVDDDGRPRSMTGVALDITARKAIEDELRASQEELRRLSGHLEQAREEERARIAREIHDELGGAMTSLKMDVSRLQRNAASLTPEVLVERTEAIIKLINDTIRTVRRIATELRPGVLDDLGLVAAIEWQLQEFGQRSGIECRLDMQVESLALDPHRSTAVFRVFQETLTNVARHAEASQVDVRLEADDGHLLLRVQDNGRGIDPRDLAGGRSLGLLGMRERVRLLAGELNIDGQPGHGTTVLVRVPLNLQAPLPPDIKSNQ